PKYYICKASVKCNWTEVEEKIEKTIRKWREIANLDLTDGVKIIGGDWWILMRPSKTEPVLRIMAEAKNQDEASKLVKEVVNTIK
ncbi:MAG: phosphoglucosamine mutase, partial [Candidatus Methanomethylicota archaeon]